MFSCAIFTIRITGFCYLVVDSSFEYELCCSQKINKIIFFTARLGGVNMSRRYSMQNTKWMPTLRFNEDGNASWGHTLEFSLFLAAETIGSFDYGYWVVLILYMCSTFPFCYLFSNIFAGNVLSVLKQRKTKLRLYDTKYAC